MTLVARAVSTVREASRDIDTGTSVLNNDRIIITAIGTVWAGVILTGTNDAGGWPGYHASSKVAVY